jgi:hypothetical protein
MILKYHNAFPYHHEPEPVTATVGRTRWQPQAAVIRNG